MSELADALVDQRCQTNANCKSWGLYTGSKTCALYDKQASQVFVEKATGDAIYSDKVASCVISSSPAPAPVPASAPATYCNKIGEEAADSIDFVNGVAGVEACNSRCKQNAACQSWGLFQPGSVCSLYDLPASQAFLEKANGDATFSDKVASCSGSSPAPAPGPAPGPASVPRCNKIGEEHADGIDFAFGVFNVETCNSNCQQNADCKSWGLFPASNVCVLYDIPASQSFIEKASGDATFSDKVTSCAATT